MENSYAVRTSKIQSELSDGAVVIASITSCTNTSNPSVLITAGLLARNAVRHGLKPPSWCKTSFAPGSRIVTKYLKVAGLQVELDALGFNTVGYGCATCIGNSGSNFNWVSQQIQERNLSVVAVLSGNRNFEGRINPDVKLNYLASPPLVVAYALAGTMDFDFDTDPLNFSYKSDARPPIYLRDIWPKPAEVDAVLDEVIVPEIFQGQYEQLVQGDEHWCKLKVDTSSDTFNWDESSTYVRQAPYFNNFTKKVELVADIVDARCLVMLGNSVTTDHISPAGNIKADSPAGKYLLTNGVQIKDFNSYGSRRGNHEVMVRGTFTNIRLQNLLVKRFVGEAKAGGWTVKFGKKSEQAELQTIYDASVAYANEQVPLIVVAGAEYGTGSSRDWAAKGAALLGVKAVIAVSFERIHRSNLIGMGVLPLEFLNEQNAETLGLKGDETFTIQGLEPLNTGEIPTTVTVIAQKPNVMTANIQLSSNPDHNNQTSSSPNSESNSQEICFSARLRIDTPTEAQYYCNGGILQYVLRRLIN